MVSFSFVAAVMAVASTPFVHAVDYQSMTLMGCYHSNQGMTYNDTWTFQSSGHCQQRCVPINKAVLATTGKLDCWCGDTMPPLDAKVDTSYCNATCAGWPAENCGSTDGTYLSVWNSGIKAKITNYGDTSSDTSSSTTSASPSVVTVGGKTITAIASSTDSASSGSSSGPSKAGIAAGVIVGVIAIAGIAGAVFFYLRRKRNREEEDEVKRQAAINSFMSAGKPGSSGGISASDSRLDPTIMTRRQSDGSIMDNQDYSRRILKVTNA